MPPLELISTAKKKKKVKTVFGIYYWISLLVYVRSVINLGYRREREREGKRESERIEESGDGRMASQVSGTSQEFTRKK